MAEKKMTKATAFAIAAEHMATVDAEVTEILLKEVARLSAPRKASGKPTKEQEANMAAADALLLAMEPEVGYTASDAGKLVGIETPQKATAILKLLVAAGAVTKAEGRKTIYTRVA